MRPSRVLCHPLIKIGAELEPTRSRIGRGDTGVRSPTHTDEVSQTLVDFVS
jgi:hypothetical protein